MQIHELPDYEFDEDSANFTVVDNGTNTGKANLSSIIGDLEERIDNIIAGGTAPSASEVTDARLGDNGVTYSSLGTSIRGQNNELFTDLKAINNQSPRVLSVTFTQASQTITSTFRVRAGVTYYLKTKTANTGQTFTVYANGDSSNTISAGDTSWTKYTSNVNAVLRVYNKTNGYVGTVEFYVAPYINNQLDRALKTYGSVSSAAALSSFTGGTNNANDFGVNTMACISDQSVGTIINGAKLGGVYTGTYLTINSTAGLNIGDNGRLQIFKSSRGDGTATRFKFGGAWSEWKTNDGFQFDFTASGQNYTTQFRVKAHHKYRIGFENSNVSGYVSTYVNGDSGYVIYMRPGAMYDFIPNIDGQLRLYNGNANNYTGNFDVKFIDTFEEVYYVGGDSSYQSLTGLLQTIQTHDGCTIYMNPGTYNIFQEYRDANIPTPPDTVDTSDYLTRCVFLPPNCKLIGLGDVTLEWNPAKANITVGEAKTWSPLNIKYGCYVENITIHTKYGRYCIHDDSHAASMDQKVEHIFKNVRCIYEYSDDSKGLNNTIGFGFGVGNKYLFEDCYFENKTSGTGGVFYGHSSSASSGDDAPTITVKNTVIISTNSSNPNAVRLQALNTSALLINTLFASCYIQGGAHLTLYDSTRKQPYKLTLLKSGNPTVTIDDSASNPYPVEVYQ